MFVGDRIDLPASLDSDYAAVCSASAGMLERIAAIDQAELWIDDGATSMTAWLAARYGMAHGTAREWVRVAHALRGLPAVMDAYSRAQLSFDQLKPLTRFVSAEEEGRWAERAQGMSPAQLW